MHLFKRHKNAWIKYLNYSENAQVSTNQSWLATSKFFLITWYIFNVFFSTKSLLFSDFTTQFHFNLDSELKIDCEQFGPIFISVTKA